MKTTLNRWPVRTQRRAWGLPGAVLLTAWLSGCGGGALGETAPAASEASATATATAADVPAATLETTAQSQASKSTRTTGSTLTAQPKNSEGRLLASNCFQCHGTMGSGGFEGIRGKEAGEVMEYLRKTANRDIMAAHAQGYTTAQLQKIIAYLQQ